ncbi:MAG: DUF2332 domain-containing protein [Chloroflexi bacterium]|nr:DUF2332 domain-containing protein [Chloroflexota bacterium]MDA1240304.1 DUF2332 domain-containing protein [Chloroflexota bacterium]
MAANASAHTALAQRFERFAEVECRGVSPLYEAIATHVARSPALLALAAHARPDSAPPNLLLAAIQFLLMRDGDPELAPYYPSISPTPSAVNVELPGAVDTFCERRADEIVHLLRTRLVQTNEPRRSAALLLGLAEAARALGTDACALVEVGASAGLNLLFDAYRIDFGAGRVAGPADGVLLTCDLHPPSVSPPDRLPLVAPRIGIDLNPLDVTDAGTVAWLDALVWPEEHDRRRTLRAALRQAAAQPPLVVAGDAMRALPAVVDGLPEGMPVCIFHSATLAYFPEGLRDEFTALLHRLSQKRPVAWLSLEGPRVLRQYAAPAPAPDALGGYMLLGLTLLNGGRAESRTLAAVNPHGRWIEWYATPH